MVKSVEELNTALKTLNDEVETVKQGLAQDNPRLVTVEESVAAFTEKLKGLEVRVGKAEPDRLSDEKVFLDIGRMIKAMVTKDYGRLKEFPFLKSVDTHSDDWKVRGWDVAKAMPGTPLYGDTGTGANLIVDAEYTARIIGFAEQTSVMMKLVDSFPMSSRKLYFLKDSTGFAYTWLTNEQTAKTEVTIVPSRDYIECETVAAWCAIVDELDEDSLINIGQYYARKFGEAWGQEFDKQCLAANAAPFTGALHGSTSILTMGAGKTSFASTRLDDIGLLIQKLTTDQQRAGAAFFMHRTIWDHLTNLKDGVGQYYIHPFDVQEMRMKGYPVYTTDVMPAITASAATTKFIAFGNPRYILHGNRVGFTFDVFGNTHYRVDYDIIFFRTRLRQAFKLALADSFAVLRTAAS